MSLKILKSGAKLSKENIRIIRPGLGLAPKYFKKLIGRKIKCNLSKGTL